MGWLTGYEGGMISGRLLSCPSSDCSFEWEVEGHEEYGAWYPEREDDALCPECGEDSEL